MAGVQIFFLTLNNFGHPFRRCGAGANGAMNLVARADGMGLTPLLQYPEMVIHPPNLYAGYTDSHSVCVRLGRYWRVTGEK